MQLGVVLRSWKTARAGYFAFGSATRMWVTGVIHVQVRRRIGYTLLFPAGCAISATVSTCKFRRSSTLKPRGKA